MATEKPIYPPYYIKPGDVKQLTLENGILEFIGQYDDRVLDFMVAYVKMEKLAESPMQVTNASLEAAARATARAWNQMPRHTLKVVMEKMEPGQIWVPEGGIDGG